MVASAPIGSHGGGALKYILAFIVLAAGIFQIYALLGKTLMFGNVNLINMLPTKIVMWITAFGAIVAGIKLLLPSRFDVFRRRFMY